MRQQLAVAEVAFASLLDGTDALERILVLHDTDADGVSAGVVLEAGLRRMGFERVSRTATSKERDAWSASNRELVARYDPQVLFILDLGSRAEPLHPGARHCLIDHHRPEGVPPEGLLISGYGWAPIPNTSLLAYELCSAVVEMTDLDWVAAVGVLSDLGEKAPFALIDQVRARCGLTALKEVTALVNAARRASHPQPETAARVLATYESPKSLLASSSDDVQTLRDAREEVRREMAEAKKAAPVFSGDVALIRVHSRCQVHPVIAQIWRTRLPKYIVMVANDLYLPGRVNFSARTASSRNLLDFFGAIDLGKGEGSYARGHDQATGGSLPFDRWNLLLEQLGFSR